ncbi:MAG: LysR family transcriptional regulator [Mailhella sp.]|nr:LysR family transcriptional regulator [Mailhella sp.]
MNWTMDQLRAFATTAEQGSFSAAGRSLGKAQSVISTQVAMLEDTIGVELFDRSSRSPVLTRAGKDLFAEAKAMLRQGSRFDACALAQYKGQADSLSIAIEQGMPFQAVSDTIAAMLKKYPFVTGNFIQKTSDEVKRMVGRGESQLGLVFGDTDRGDESFEWICLGQVNYCIVAAKDSELARLARVTEQDLSQYRQILYRGGGSYLLNSSCWQVNNVFCAIYWASLGIGWTVVPRMVMERIMKGEPDFLGNLCMLSMEQLELAVNNFYLIYNQGFVRRELLDFFCSDLRVRCSSLSTERKGYF